MFSGQATVDAHIFEFWDVFIEEVPRVPTVDELICRVVAVSFPEGLVTDRTGALINPPIDASIASKQILFTLKTAIETEKDFWFRQLRLCRVYTPYGWGVRLSANVAITEAETQILDALEWVGNIYRLDTLFWQAFDRTEEYCRNNDRRIEWGPFQQKR
ncbi:hypothetical protein F4678DRAFT_484855 [Xylaria arbuscula]|nr:hypothetical protein F4678DRAFT_484855 [Xylaria arbuscula]